VYVCEKRYQQDRDVYRPCTKKDDPRLRTLRKKRPAKDDEPLVAKGMSFVERLRRDYSASKRLGQWFPLCGTAMGGFTIQTVGFDVLQLLLVCVLTSFCGMSRDIRKSFCSGMCSEIGALCMMLVFSLSMFFVPTGGGSDVERERIMYGDSGQSSVHYMINGMKWSMSVGLLGRILFLSWFVGNNESEIPVKD